MDKRVELLLLKAKAAEKAGDRGKAAAIYGQALSFAPKDARARDALTRLRPATSQQPKPAPAGKTAVAGTPLQMEMTAIVQLFAAGRLDEVVTRAETLLQRYPDAVVPLNVLGVTLGRLGRADEAVAAFERAIAANPGYAEGHYNLGNVLFDHGRLDEAIAAYRRATDVRPAYHSAYNNIGNALKEQGKLDEAIAAFGAALAAKPDYVEAHFNLGNTLRDQGKLGEAIAAYRAALAIKPDAPDIHNNLGNALREAGLWQDAVATFRELVAIRSDYAEGHYNLGNALSHMRRPDEAIAAFERAVAIRPDYAEAWVNLGDLLIERDDVDAAAAACERGLALKPGYHNAYNCLGNVHRLRGQPAEAEQALRRALEIRPDYVDARINLGNLFTEQGRFDEAEHAYRAVAAAHPDHDVALCSLGTIDLLRGRMESGWKLYDWRRAMPDSPAGRPLPKPIWLGAENVAGKTIFVHHEQGLGDAVQFVRYAALLRDRGARVIMSVHPPLLQLITQALSGIEVITGEPPAEAYDYHVPMMSLPQALGTTLDTIPAQVPYLFAEPGRVARWRERFGTHGFKIGICWQGSVGRLDRGRSVPLAQFAGLARLPGVRLISLYKGSGEEQLEGLPAGMTVEVPGPDLDADGAFLDTAAIMEMCDLVISSDTSVPHVAGALARPVWLMLRHVPDWRWLMGRDDSPWYPTMRLFRQPEPGDWATPFARAEAELSALLAAQPSLTSTLSGST